MPLPTEAPTTRDLIFIYMRVCVFPACMCVGIHRGKKQASNPLEVELRLPLGCLLYVALRAGGRPPWVGQQVLVATEPFLKLFMFEVTERSFVT